MILSMTGYGKGNATFGDKTYNVDVKSLNSKTFDIRTRLPAMLAEKEFLIRKIAQDGAIRGRIELTITLDGENGGGDFSFNKALFKQYYQELKNTTSELGINDPDIFSAIMRIPAVTNGSSVSIEDEEWDAVIIAINDALVDMAQFRKDEGSALKSDLVERVSIIKDSIPKLAQYEDVRSNRLKERLRKTMEDFFVSEKVDQSRFEQEVLYYVERLDITEEKVRLLKHCDYFMEQIENKDTQVGKILSFISQEMGREINTIGSKAQDSDLQQIVVVMKDELEKIKEQLANIL